jgi:serine/threonine protein kinase/tetratricopeptide (TPR) repeat protein
MNERDIFIDALQIESPNDRQAFLDRVCGGDSSLRERVEALLRAHDKGNSFLESPPIAAQDATIEQTITEKPGTVIGPYKLLQKIGEGGFGVVYMADQTEPVKRRVALKIIKPGMDTQQVIARFEAERQALAMMDHPNIAKVLDAGTTESGRPYFVMDLVKGVPITQYCDERHLTPQERLELFVPVCQAVQHAHQKGIIHRDLKPSNVLIALYDDRPVPKVIDFGVAKATSQKLTEKTIFTHYGQIVGTLEYMSPEQANLNQWDIDTRSDIYSLGVLLYELLTGNTPFDRQRLQSAAFDEMMRIIREEEPPRPSLRLSTSESLPSIAANRHIEPKRLNTLVRGELDWIVMKALEKDRTRRYETANGFAADIERYLNDQPVVACPPSASYRFRKFARRNKGALVTAGLLAVMLILGTVISAWQAIRATRSEAVAQDALDEAKEQRDRAREAEKRAQAQRQEADANFQLARQAVDEYFTLVSESKLLNEPGLQPLRKDLLEAAARFHESLVARHSDDANIRADLAAAHLRLVGVYSAYGNAEKMLSAFQQGVRMAERLLEEQPDAPEVHRKLSGCRRFRGDDSVLWKWIMKHPEEARKHLLIYEEAIHVWEEFARRNPGVDGFPADISVFWSLIGAFHWSMGQQEEFLRARQKVVEIREKLVRDYPEVVEHRAQLAHGHIGLAHALESPSPTKSVSAFRRAVDIRKQLVEEFPDVPEHRFWLASYYCELGENRGPRAVLSSEELESYLRQSVELLEELADEFPYEPLYRKRIIRSRRALADLLGRTGQTEKMIEVCSKLIRIDPDNPLKSLTAFRDALTTMERFDEAAEPARRIVEIRAKSVAASPKDRGRRKDLAWAHYELGNIMFAAGKDQEAADAYRPAFDLFEQLATEFPDVARHQDHLAYVLATCPAKQFRDGRRAVAAAKRVLQLTASNPKCWFLLGRAQYTAGEYCAVIASIEKGRSSPDLAVPTHVELLRAMAYWQSGDRQRGRELYEEHVKQTANDASGLEYRAWRAEADKMFATTEPEEGEEKPEDESGRDAKRQKKSAAPGESGEPKAESGVSKAESGS